MRKGACRTCWTVSSRRRTTTGVALFSLVVFVVVGMLGHLSIAAPPRPSASPNYDLAPAETAPADDVQALYQAVNGANGVVAYFGTSGMTVVPAGKDETRWKLTLGAAGLGYGETVRLAELPRLSANGSELSFDYGRLVETIRNSELGLEQTFTIASRPGPGDGRLFVDVSLNGDLLPRTSTGSDAIDLIAADSETVLLRLAKVQAYDAEQRELGLSMTTADVKGGTNDRGVRLIVKDVKATYPITVRTVLTSADATKSSAPTSALASPVGDPGRAPDVTTLLSPTGDGGFENGATFAANGWTVVNNATHTWQVGGVAVPFAGTNSGYISNNGGAAYAYTNTVSQTSHFYRDLTVPAGESAVTLTFQLKVVGESGFDRLLVYTAPTSVTPVAGTPASSSTTLTGATLVYTGVPLSGTSYTSQTVTLPTSLAGTTFRLIFTWQNDGSFGTNPPASIDNISVTSDLPPPPPADDVCPTAPALSLNLPLSGTLSGRINDYSIPTPTTTCFPGVGQSTSTAVGRDAVYSFTAPSAGLYSFRTQFNTSLGGGNLVTYLYKPAGPAYSCPTLGGLTCDASIVAANRNGNSSQWLATEEVMCQSLAAGQKVYLFLDESAANTVGGAYIVQVNPCTQETEANGTPATANSLVGACPMEGSINPGGDADFFALAPTTANQRIFAMADGAAASSTDFDLRVTTPTDTLEYDDANLDAPFGGLAPTADGTKATGASTFIRMSHFNATTASEPYRLYAVVRPDSSQATAETEPNDTIATANVIASGYISGTTSLSTDVDYFAVTALAGDLIFVGLDQDPGYTGAALATKLSLVDATNTTLVAVADGSTTSSARAPAGGTLTSTAPVSNGQALAWRVPTAGTYYVKVEYSSGTAPKNYLLSISVNCTVAGCQGDADCNDGNVCTDDVCSAGICSHANNAAACASDNNVCTDDVCSAGACTHPDNTAACNDNNPCTSGDACSGGACAGTPNTDPCDDGNPCTSGNTCSNGICGTYNTDPCIDGNPCTLGDTCSNGVCTPGTGALPAPVQICNTGLITINDNAAATPYPSTIAVAGQPSIICSTKLSLNGLNHTFPSDVNMLLLGPGGQKFVPLSSVIGGTDWVNINYVLDDAAAALIPAAGTPASGSFRPSDYDAATTFPSPAPAGPYQLPATAGTATFGSVFTGTNPNGTWSLYVADDAGSDFGTIGGGWCVNVVAVCGADADCNDGNVCTNDACVNAICTHTNNTAACDDGSACTTGDTCTGGICVGGAPPACDDGNPCTSNTCNPATGLCENPPITCTDNNVCTDDTCDPASGCVFTNNTAPCDDGQACTTNDVCSGGSCGGTAVRCNDGNTCTDDACNPATGACVHTYNHNACDDGSACTSNDQCTGPAACGFGEAFDAVTAPALPAGWTSTVTGSGSAWTTVGTSSDSTPNSAFGFDGFTGTVTPGDEVLVSPPIPIVSATASVTFQNRWSFESATSCFDAGVLEIKIGAGSFTDIVTAGGSFVSGGYTGIVSALFSNPLANRAAWCNTSAGYPAYVTSTVNLPAAAAGQTIQLRWRVGFDTSAGEVGQNIDSIVLSDACATVCTGSTVDCNDSNPCTDDSCDPASGCVHTDNSAPCNDGNACTTGDTCGGGSCQPGTVLDCNDNNPCTDDSCDSTSGCVHTNNTASCNDNNACTSGDVCGNGACAGTAITCNDSNVCTTDSCDPASGCVFTNNTIGCDDGNPCTVGDTCGNGVCNPGTAVPAPAEAAGVNADSKTTFSWGAVPSATRYDVVRGSLGGFPVGSDVESCFDDLAGPALTDATLPDPGAGFWYLPRGENACGNGTYGTQGAHGAPGAPRVTTTCP